LDLQSVPLTDLITQARMAPSVHNSQPWMWMVDGDTVTLFADYRRRLDRTDPAGRDLLISCGAALHHLAVAAAGEGWEARIRHLPNPYNTAELAKVTFTRREVDAQAAQAASALRRRHTDRRRTDPRPVPRPLLDRLLAQAAMYGVAAFAVVSATARQNLLGLLAEADEAHRHDPAYRDEIADWVDRPGGEGIPSGNLLRHRPLGGGHAVLTRFPSGDLEEDEDPEDLPPAALLVVCTSSDDVPSQLRAGEALSAILLEGTSAGLSMTPFSQATEVDRTRELLQNELLRDAAYPQILIRVGWPAANGLPVPPTPRRPVADVMCDVQSLPTSFSPYVD